jgi:hypothetical protein
MNTAPLPVLPSNVGKRGKIVSPGSNTVSYFTIKEEIRRNDSSREGKILCLQKIEFESGPHTEIRLGYYVIGTKPKMKDKWVWGQFAVLMVLDDFKALIREAETKGWI